MVTYRQMSGSIKDFPGRAAPWPGLAQRTRNASSGSRKAMIRDDS
ncbi:hypothetical protein [Streptomyces griseoluteus]